MHMERHGCLVLNTSCGPLRLGYPACNRVQNPTGSIIIISYTDMPLGAPVPLLLLYKGNRTV